MCHWFFTQTNSYLEKTFSDIFCFNFKQNTWHKTSYRQPHLMLCCYLSICLFHFTSTQIKKCWYTGIHQRYLRQVIVSKIKCIFNQLIGESVLWLIHFEFRKSGGSKFSTTVLSEFFTNHHNQHHLLKSCGWTFLFTVINQWFKINK